MSYGKMGDGIGSAMIVAFVLLCIFVPLGLWKLVEIAVWIFKHLHWQ